MLRELIDSLTLDSNFSDGKPYRRVLAKQVISASVFFANILFVCQNFSRDGIFFKEPYAILMKYKIDIKSMRAYPVSRFRLSLKMMSTLSVILRKNFFMFSEICLERLKKISSELEKKKN